MAKTASNNGLTNDSKTIITVLLLILVYPIGLILVYVWMKWKMWIKLLVSLPLLLGLLIFFSALFTTTNPGKAASRGKCVKEYVNSGLTTQESIRRCVEREIQNR